MRVGSFSVLVPEGVEKDSGHVQMQHNTQYGLRLGNHGSVSCDADVYVDGKPIGNFRLYAGQTFTLERPAHDTGRFTFFKANSEQGQAVGEDVGQLDKGLIVVIFRPEKQRRHRNGGICGQSTMRHYVPTAGPIEGMLRSSNVIAPKGQSWLNELTGGALVAPGVTGLTGQSKQSFTNVQGLDYDPDGEIQISLRLVADIHEARKLTAVTRANPMPHPVD